jgi:putative radical SAM enzyme (TIGR03279 family)
MTPTSARHALPAARKIHGGVVASVAPDSLAASLGLCPNDVVLAVNGHPVEDVIDVQFYAAEDEVEIVYRRDGRRRAALSRRQANQALGLDFTHPTFDIDIRRCNNRCPFCFVLQMAPRLRRTLYVKDDDFRYSFLYGHFVTLTNLSRRDWKRIEQQHLSPLYLSVHATHLPTRRLCLGNPAAPDIRRQLRWLAERSIEVHTQVVVTPGLNDGAQLATSVGDLAEFYPCVPSVSIVPVGLTRHHKHGLRLNTVEEAEQVLAAAAQWQAGFLRRFGVRFVYPTDEWFLITGKPVPARKYYAGLALEENGLGKVRRFLDEWRWVKRRIETGKWQMKNDTSEGPPAAIQTPNSKLQNRRATLVTGKLFEETLRQAADEFNRLTGAKLEVAGVVNERLGHSVTVAGLLMGQDVMAQLEGRNLGEFVVLPRVMFSHSGGVSLDDMLVLDIARRLNRPVFLADAMGDVLDAFTGRNQLHFDPADDLLSPAWQSFASSLALG